MASECMGSFMIFTKSFPLKTPSLSQTNCRNRLLVCWLFCNLSHARWSHPVTYIPVKQDFGSKLVWRLPCCFDSGGPVEKQFETVYGWRASAWCWFWPCRGSWLSRIECQCCCQYVNMYRGLLKGPPLSNSYGIILNYSDPLDIRKKIFHNSISSGII